MGLIRCGYNTLSRACAGGNGHLLLWKAVLLKMQMIQVDVQHEGLGTHYLIAQAYAQFLGIAWQILDRFVLNNLAHLGNSVRGCRLRWPCFLKSDSPSTMVGALDVGRKGGTALLFIITVMP